jgi:hypothetical protein
LLSVHAYQIRLLTWQQRASSFKFVFQDEIMDFVCKGCFIADPFDPCLRVVLYSLTTKADLDCSMRERIVVQIAFRIPLIRVILKGGETNV